MFEVKLLEKGDEDVERWSEFLDLVELRKFVNELKLGSIIRFAKLSRALHDHDVKVKAVVQSAPYSTSHYLAVCREQMLMPITVLLDKNHDVPYE